jgi:hypothetical protein
VLQLDNSTPFRATLCSFPDARGIDTLFVVVKATFAIGASLTVAEQQVAPCAADVPWGEPGQSSLRYATELHLEKPGTDVVMNARAWPPGGAPVPQLDVLLAVAGRTKVVRVFGERQWVGGLLGASISPPVPFESMPIVYERAFGGGHELAPGSDRMLAEERNPVGRGFRGKRKAKDFVGERLPNVENPRRPIRAVGDGSEPQGFGFIAPAWLPRRAFAGTYDEAWQKTRAPFLPADFDPRFFHAAHPDFVFDRWLDGGEPVEVIHASRRGPLRFELPRCELDVEARIAGRTETPLLHLETVLIEPDDDRLCLLWRGSVPCDKQLLRVERVRLAPKRLLVGGKSV